jgi:hypothetical protein
MTQLIEQLTTKTQIQGNHATIQYLNYNPNQNVATLEEVIVIAKTKTAQATIDQTTINWLNNMGLNATQKTKETLHNQIASDLNKDLINLIDNLYTKPKQSKAKSFLYWLTSSSPIFYIKSPQQLYNHIVSKNNHNRIFIILPPHLIYHLTSHPNFIYIDNITTDDNNIQLIGHINSNTIFVNHAANQNYIQSGSIPTNIYFASTNPQISEEPTNPNQPTSTIQIKSKTILHHIPQLNNNFYHFNATNKKQPLYKKLLKL